ncbi:hypothetical protein FQZ97_871740 [compost metagenome]
MFNHEVLAGVGCMTTRGCSASQAWTSESLEVASLSTIRCNFRCLGVLRSIRRKNLSHSSWRYRSWHIEITVPSSVLSAANSVVVPLRLWSWVMVPARPGSVRLSA